MSLDRYARQRLLAEVGDTGQRRLAEGTVSVPSGPAAAFAVEYLQRAGVGSVEVEPEGTSAGVLLPEHGFRHEAFFRHRVSGELGMGAWQALSGIRSLLESRSASEGTD